MTTSMCQLFVNNKFFAALTISSFVPAKEHLREALLFCFRLKKSAAESHRLLLEAYGENAASSTTCKEWLRWFSSGDFDTADKLHPGQPEKFEDVELTAILDSGSSQTLQDLATSLNVTSAAVNKRLHAMRMIFLKDVGSHTKYNTMRLTRP